MPHQRPPSLADVKLLLSQYAKSRAGGSTQKLEAEFGDLLLYFIRLADKAGVDLIENGIKQIERRNDTLPRLLGDKSR
jgi:NTP pyrophosphatase (non-canonical NTP hydrolase)